MTAIWILAFAYIALLGLSVRSNIVLASSMKKGLPIKKAERATGIYFLAMILATLFLVGTIEMI